VIPANAGYLEDSIEDQRAPLTWPAREPAFAPNGTQFAFELQDSGYGT
jgi:hypothetical protein